MDALTVLIVEDDEQFTRYLVELLSQYGCRITTASNGKIGINECEQSTPDVILLDLVMPEMDGIETLQHIRSVYSDIPIITMSGGNHGPANVYLTVTEKLGAYKALIKPFDCHTLLHVLAELFPAYRFQDS